MIKIFAKLRVDNKKFRESRVYVYLGLCVILVYDNHFLPSINLNLCSNINPDEFHFLTIYIKAYTS